jgi:hypothetical protein
MSMDPYRPPDDVDFDNPYAAPKASFQREPVSFHESMLIPCSIDAITRRAWSIFQNNMGSCLWVVWAVVGVEVGIGFMLRAVLEGLQIAMPGEQATVMAIYGSLYCVSLIIQAWLGIGMNLGLLKIARGQPVSFDVLFSGGRYLLRSILAWIIMILLFAAFVFVPVFMAGVIAAALRGQAAILFAALISGGILWIGFLIYMCTRLWQFYFLVMDQDAGVFESIQLSWEITRGRAGTIILVYLSQMVFIVAGILAVCVGLVIAIPFSNLLLVVAYLSLLGRPQMPDEGATSGPQAREWFTNWEEEL